MKKIGIITLATMLMAWSALATDLYKDSFEGGLTNWFLLQSNDVSTASVSTPAAAVTDGAKAIEFTHTISSGIIELARMNQSSAPGFLTALKDPGAKTMSIDFFIPASATTNTSWAQANFVLQSTGINVSSSLGLPTRNVDSLVTVELDLTGLDLASLNWAQVTLYYNGSTPAARSPIYVDNFRIHDVAAAPVGFYSDSFEGSATGWSNINVEASTIIGFTNAPTEAVTDGLEAMVLTHNNGAPGQVTIARLQHDQNAEWFEAMKSTNTPVISVDVYIPDTSIPNYWANFTMSYQGNFGVGGDVKTVTAETSLTLGTNNTFTAEIVFDETDMAGISGSNWGQLSIAMNGGDTGTLSPIYLDNFRVHDGGAEEPGGYDAWAAKYPAMGAENGPSDNPDGDNLNNLYEYGLDGDPTDPLSQGIPPVYETVIDGGTWFMYTYPVRSNADSGLEYYLETTTDLVTGNWVDAGYEHVATGVTGGDFNYSTNRVSVDAHNQDFIRLIIEEVLVP